MRGPVSIDAAAVKQDDVAGQPPGFAEIMGRHHHLDAALADGADDILDRLGGGGIEARGRLVQEQYGRVAGERARQREALLLAAGQSASGTIGQMFEADQCEKLADATSLAPRAGRPPRASA